MKTLWRHLLDFIKIAAQAVYDVFSSPIEMSDPIEKEKRKRSENKIERFSIPSRRVLGLAQEAAEALQHDHIGPEHVLLGLIHEVSGVAGRVLALLNVHRDEAEALVVTFSDAGKRKSSVNLELTAKAKKLLELSVDEARRNFDYQIDTEHLLLGLLRLDDGPAIEVLRGLGLTPEQVRDYTLELMRTEAEE